MILPTKRLSTENSLLGVGADALRILDEPKSVSRVWDEIKRKREHLSSRGERLTFEWFVLALDLLFLMGLISLENGILRRSAE